MAAARRLEGPSQAGDAQTPQEVPPITGHTPPLVEGPEASDSPLIAPLIGGHTSSPTQRGSTGSVQANSVGSSAQARGGARRKKSVGRSAPVDHGGETGRHDGVTEPSMPPKGASESRTPPTNPTGEDWVFGQGSAGAPLGQDWGEKRDG